MSVKVTVNKFQINEALETLDKAAIDKFSQHRLEIGEEFVEICTQYVPYDFENKTPVHLAYQGHAYISESKDELKAVWSRTKNGFDVAYAQYYGSYNHPYPRDGHWDQVAMYYKGDVFRKRVENILK